MADPVHTYACLWAPRALPVWQGAGPFPVCHANVKHGQKKNTHTHTHANEVIQMSTPHLWILNDTLSSIAAPSIELPFLHAHTCARCRRCSWLHPCTSRLIHQTEPGAFNCYQVFSLGTKNGPQLDIAGVESGTKEKEHCFSLAVLFYNQLLVSRWGGDVKMDCEGHRCCRGLPFLWSLLAM